MNKWAFIINLDKIKTDKEYFYLSVLVHILALTLPVNKINFYGWNFNSTEIIYPLGLIVLMLLSLSVIIYTRLKK